MGTASVNAQALEIFLEKPLNLSMGAFKIDFKGKPRFGLMFDMFVFFVIYKKYFRKLRTAGIYYGKKHLTEIEVKKRHVK